MQFATYGRCDLALALICAIVVALGATLARIALTGELRRVKAHLVGKANDSSRDECCDVRRDGRYGERRVPDYERSDIVIPEWSGDTRECEDYENPRECSLLEGYAACFECVESRFALRVCAHLSKDVTLYDEERNRSFVLPANSSPAKGYCVGERFARNLRDLLDDAGGRLADARKRCGARNGEWLIARRRTVGDSSYNFVCRCKYPHLLTNVAGPQSPCTRDVACNGHGRLDEDSRLGLRDPYVDGRCLCDDGWIADRDESHGTGPYCREATFEEWPSAFYGEKRHEDDLELYSDRVDEAFARRIRTNRLDEDRPVWLPNPCGSSCELRRADNGAWFCADRVVVVNRDDGKLRILSVGIGVIAERDYLRGNGGSLPNRCLELDELNPDTVALQFLSQPWHDGDKFAQEVGFLTGKRALLRLADDAWHADEKYRRFIGTLQPARNDAFLTQGIVWTFNARELTEHRVRFNRTLGRLLSPAMTDLAFGTAKTWWFPFPFYNQLLGVNFYYHSVEPTMLEARKYRKQKIYKCPDQRGLDYVKKGFLPSVSDHDHAHKLARSMVPICYSSRDNHPLLNCWHPNVTGCVFFINGTLAVYSYAANHPRGMNMLRFCEARNAPQEAQDQGIE